MQRIQRLLEADQPVKWLFYGDSITHGARHTFGQRDYTQLFSERIRYEMGRGMDVVINTAISGHTTVTLLEGHDWRVRQFQPHVVFVMIGTNDCFRGNGISVSQFTANLNRLVDCFEADHILPVLQTSCPLLPNSDSEREPTFADYMPAVREVAAQRQLPLVDHMQYWQQRPALHYVWMSDGIHPNHFGHRAFAHLLFKSLEIFDPASDTCRLYVPGS
jgi:lysophospholipase L1-like esterase